jgi:hypothetical protein
MFDVARRLGASALVAALTLAVWACSPAPGQRDSPSDDPADWDAEVDRSARYALTAGTPRWIVPGGAALASSEGLDPARRSAPGLPPGLAIDRANNNVDIVFFDGRLFIAWRTAPSHFASREARMIVLSSTDLGQSWRLEHEIALSADVREPRFVAMGGRLLLYFVELGINPLAFEPREVWWIERRGQGDWSDETSAGIAGEVLWSLRRRNGVAYMTSYSGDHYGPGSVDVHLRRSPDGVRWQHVDPAKPVVYRGGVSEAAIELDRDGDLWAVTRNEDGDQSGFGSHVCRAQRGALGDWACSAKSDPQRYDSPWLFRHGDEIYLAARRDIGGPFDQGRDDLTFEDKQTTYLREYSLRPKRTALYRVDRDTQRVVHLFDLPSAGDTASPSVRQLSAHRFLLANYSSPLDQPNIDWLSAQVSPRGTGIYLVELTFVPQQD